MTVTINNNNISSTSLNTNYLYEIECDKSPGIKSGTNSADEFIKPGQESSLTPTYKIVGKFFDYSHKHILIDKSQQYKSLVILIDINSILSIRSAGGKIS